ncbi:inositol polyphosphate-4-phosphatase type I A-like isoform X2 [Amphibalanus amphitrite]|uniref:inositol polyphosphate-4-phosphatase type I A-like isoform X2 n=1 Tax=Amphibalanus amphitrite TaxID=1232801 RepID=UPI001C927C3E|nr:inositol polyphosphate-4-phosphatase type I A-like isoform X2 [Amphibalanus amphitrite]
MPKSKSGDKKKKRESSGGSVKSNSKAKENGTSSAPREGSAPPKQTSNSKEKKAEKSKKKEKIQSEDVQKSQSQSSSSPKSTKPGGSSNKVMDAMDELKPLFDDPWSKSYALVQEDGSDLRARELLADTQYSFQIPIRLIELFSKDEAELLDEMKQLKSLLPPLSDLVRDAVRRHEDIIASYSVSKTTLKAHKGPFFKRSTVKGDPSLEFVPVNLHLQRLVADAPAADRSVIHDVITVGAFTAFSQKFRDGGLLQYAELLGGRPVPGGGPCCSLPRMVERLAAGGRTALDGDKASAMYQAEGVVQAIEEARSRILEACVGLLEAEKADDSAAIPALVKIITAESSRVDVALHSPVVADTHQQLASSSATGAAPHLGCLPVPPLAGRLVSLPAAAAAPADWRSAAAAVSAAAAGLCAAEGAALAAAVPQLRAGCDAALAAARLARATTRLREQRRTQLLRDAARHRRDICFSHAVTAASVGLLTRLWCRPADPAFMEQLASVGPLLQFEGLLSYYGHEAGMVQDMVVAVQDLEGVEFILEPAAAPKGPGVPEVRLEGGRGRLQVYLPTPKALLAGKRAGKQIRFHPRPVFFNVGINEQATFSEYVGGTGPQRAFNEDSFRQLADYVNLCSEQGVLPKPPSSGDESCPDVGDLIIQLGQTIRSGRPKEVKILQLASQICRAVSGIRFCSCKSAKDRTSMSVTLEQVNILSRELQLASAERPRALALMRTDGARRRNAEKNVGSPRFSFNTLQLLTMPSEYRAPPGTYGAVES